MKVEALKKISLATLRRQTAERIQDAILSGSLKLGERLVERKLAEHLGCSQATVREALVQLETEGFIAKKPNSSTFVTDFTRADAEKSFALRRVLDGYAVEEASRFATTTQIQELERCYLGMVEAALKGDQVLFLERDRAWHEAIWNLSGNEYLIAALRRLVLPQLAFSAVRFFGGNAPDLIADAKSHLPMLEAIKSKKPEEIGRSLDEIIDKWQAVWTRLGWTDDETKA